MTENKNIIIPIIYPSSATFWLGKYSSIYSYAFSKRSLTSLPRMYSITSAEAKKAADFLSLETPLSLLASRPTSNHRGKYYRSRFLKAPANQKCFFKIPATNIYVASPELTFLQAAADLDFLHLIQFGINLCAQYYADPTEKFQQTKRPMVTTADQIKDFLNSNPKIHGVEKARKAARFLVDSSNSPMETALAAILRITAFHGGYGLYGLEMNQPISLSNLGEAIVGVPEIHGDIVWQKSKACLEYNSKAVHNNDITFYEDINRANALREAGWTYIGVTPANIRDFESMEKLADLIMHTLNFPNHGKLLKKYKSKREEAYKILFNKDK